MIHTFFGGLYLKVVLNMASLSLNTNNNQFEVLTKELLWVNVLRLCKLETTSRFSGGFWPFWFYATMHSVK